MTMQPLNSCDEPVIAISQAKAPIIEAERVLHETEAPIIEAEIVPDKETPIIEAELVPKKEAPSENSQEESLKRSWANIVNNSTTQRPLMTKFKKLSVEPMKDGVYNIPADIFARGISKRENSIVGYFLDKTLLFHLVKE